MLRVAVQDVADPEKSAGIQTRDILLAINGTEIIHGAQLNNHLLEGTSPGQ